MRRDSEVNLEVKVWREDVWHTGMLHQALWEAWYLELTSPFDPLSMVLILFFFALLITVRECLMSHSLIPCLHSRDCIAHSNIHVYATIHCGCEVIDDFHQSLRILTQVESLTWLIVDVPVKVLQVVSLLLGKHFKVKLEEKFALTSSFGILVSFQLHNLKVVKLHFLVRVQDLNLRSIIVLVNAE